MILWGGIVGFAYVRRPFGGSPRNYLLAFMVLWALTMGALMVLSVAEAS